MIQAYSRRNRAVIESGGNLVGYLLAGYPDRQSFFNAAKGCELQGLTVLEVGYPSKRPVSDGEVIRRAHALADASVCYDIAFWQELRRTVKLPIWLMAYSGDLVAESFYRTLCEERLIDALVIPDMDLSGRKQLLKEAARWEVDVLGFLTPESGDGETADTLESFPVIYYTLYTGPTGMNNQAHSYAHILQSAGAYSHKGIFAGFGIQTPQQVTMLLDDGFAGAIIGTVMIRQLNRSTQELYELVRSFTDKIQKGGQLRGAHSGV